MELARPSLWLLFFLLFCIISDPISANAEDKKLPSSPANLEELEFLKGLLDYEAEVGFRCERLRKEQKHMKGGSVGRILKGGRDMGNKRLMEEVIDVHRLKVPVAQPPSGSLAPSSHRC